jgi:nucleotide-binding universal stress UspA family protein
MSPHIKILVPTDFSETADAALTYAKSLAEPLRATVHLLHVFQDPYTRVPYGSETYVPPPPGLLERALADTRAQLLQRVDPDDDARFAGAWAIVEGLVAKEIVKYADDHAMDLIVMGTRGRRGVAHLFLGSVAEHVVRTAGCPVLTVRHADTRAGAAAKVA